MRRWPRETTTTRLGIPSGHSRGTDDRPEHHNDHDDTADTAGPGASAADDDHDHDAEIDRAAARVRGCPVVIAFSPRV